MDRGRVGLDVVGNRSIREAAIRKRRREHLERLKKIRARPPGNSPTLDNMISEDLLGFHNSRRVIAETAKGEVVERENKALLQRISKILTAPSRLNSDEDYWKMKKLFVRVNASEKYEKEREEKKRAEAFERIYSTGAYYNHKIWEEDYQRQLKGQKFMRQVRYKRPKDFVDPFAPTSGDEKDSKAPGRSGRSTGSPSSSRSRSRGRDGDTSNGDASHVEEAESDNYGDDKFDGDGDDGDEAKREERSSRVNFKETDGRADKDKRKITPKKPSSSKHVNRIRNLRQDDDDDSHKKHANSSLDRDSKKSTRSSDHHHNASSAKKKQSLPAVRTSASLKKQSTLTRMQESGKAAGGSHAPTSQNDDEEVFGAIDIYAPRLLAHVHRNLKITDGDFGETKANAVTKRVLTDVQCWRKGVPSNEIRRWERTRSYSAISLNDYTFSGSDSPAKLGSVSGELNVAMIQIITLSAELLEGSESLSCTMWLDIKKLVDAWVFEKGVEDTWGATAEEIASTYSSSNNGSFDVSNPTNTNSNTTTSCDSAERQGALLQEVAKDLVSNMSLMRLEALTPAGTVVTLEMVLPEYVAVAVLTRLDVSNRADASSSSKGDKSFRSGADYRKQSIFEQLAEHAEEDLAEAEAEYCDDTEPPKPVFKCGVRIPFEVFSGRNESSGPAVSGSPHPSHMHSMPSLHSISGPSHHSLALSGSSSALGLAGSAGGFAPSSGDGNSTASSAAGGRKSSTFIPVIPVKESVYVLMRMRDAGDDKAHIAAHLIDNFSSVQLRHNGKRTTLVAGTVFTTTVPLPTIMAIDHELVSEFFGNLKENFRLLYDRNHASTTLCLKEEGEME